MCRVWVCSEWNILIQQPQKTFLWSIKLTPLFLFELDGKDDEKHKTKLLFSINFDFICSHAIIIIDQHMQEWLIYWYLVGQFEG